MHSLLPVLTPVPETGWGLPDDASVHGHRIDLLMNTTSVFVGILFGVTVAWLAWAAFKHGTRRRADYDHGSGRAQVLKASILSVVIFAVVDGNLLVNGLLDLDQAFWNFDKAQATPGAVRIEVNAHQWAWDARYAGVDGKFNTADDIVTLNDIRVPIDTPVVVQLAATDVIHSFSLPNFRVKQDAVPGMINRLWFQAKKTGDFDIACAQHCGAHHYKMRGQLTVMSEADFKAWSAQAGALSQRAYDAEDPGSHWGWDWEKGNH